MNTTRTTGPELVLVRHGRSQANDRRVISNRDLPHDLTGPGREQALAVATELAAHPYPVAALYTSPIPRARQTAQLIGLRLGADRIPLRLAPALSEIDCGVMEGRSDDVAWAAHDAALACWRDGDLAARVPGGESLLEVLGRVTPFLTEVARRHARQDVQVVLVTHGSLLQSVLPLVVEGLQADLVRPRPLPTGGIVRLVPQGAGLRCLSWDGTAPGSGAEH